MAVSDCVPAMIVGIQYYGQDLFGLPVPLVTIHLGFIHHALASGVDNYFTVGTQIRYTVFY